MKRTTILNGALWVLGISLWGVVLRSESPGDGAINVGAAPVAQAKDSAADSRTRTPVSAPADTHGAVAAKAAANGAGATGDTAPTAVESKSCINVNTADAAQLEDLPGIGPALAGRIVEYRQKHGAFKKGADLTQVKGIGKVKLEKMEPRICF